jgi:multiple sugar transport system ATP-binding protein
MASVTLDHVWKRYGDVVAVNDISLEAKDQEFLVLVGPSGCGKTTTLRMVAGLDDVSQGTVSIGDRVVNELSPKNRDIAMVFQSYALYPHMNVFDNMAFALKLHKVPKTEIKERVQRAADILGIGNLLDRKPRQLSGGQRQRVALGRAIVRQPAVFLMDEPLSNLDAKLRVQMRAELGKLHQQLKTTVIYVTHDQTEAMTMGDRIAIMNDGLLQQVDTPQMLYDFPTNIFVAGFIGSPAMNMLHGELQNSDGAPSVRGHGWTVPLPAPLREAPNKAADSHVVLGVRPEHLSPNGATSEGEGTLPAKVEVVEHLGNELLLYLSVDSANIMARVPPETNVEPGQSMNLKLDSTNLHLFDEKTGDALGHSRSTSAA